MNALAIRDLVTDDYASWRRLWVAYLAFYEVVLDDDVIDTAWSRLLSDDSGEFNGMVAEVDGVAIGLVHFLYHRHGWKVEPVCYLQDLFVDEAVRGTGAGRALIEAVYAAADRDGAGGVYWLTQEFNAQARQLYDRIAVKTPFVQYRR